MVRPGPESAKRVHQFQRPGKERRRKIRRPWGNRIDIDVPARQMFTESSIVCFMRLRALVVFQTDDIGRNPQFRHFQPPSAPRSLQALRAVIISGTQYRSSIVELAHFNVSVSPAKRPHADRQGDERIWIAHLRRICVLAALVIAGVIGAVVFKGQIEARQQRITDAAVEAMATTGSALHQDSTHGGKPVRSGLRSSRCNKCSQFAPARSL